MNSVPASSVTVTDESSCVALWKRTPREYWMPRRRNARSSPLLIAMSSFGTRWGRASTIVTSAPKERHTLANSTPITPPPRMSTRSGMTSRARACSLVRIRPPISSPGSERL